ncbi:MAG: hypothetical protein JSW10_08165 [Pseudomonadota bacterium]|nr:MAG: hypothetical protein JSW10_08165 [Pseudomonadota bacterium]
MASPVRHWLVLPLLVAFATVGFAQDDMEDDVPDTAPLRHHPDYGDSNSDDAFRASEQTYNIQTPAADPGLDTPEPLLDDSPPDRPAAPTRQQVKVHPHAGRTRQHPRSDANQIRGIELPSGSSQ